MDTAHSLEERRAHLRTTLHERGMRMTPQRQLVLDALLVLEHATPEQVCAHVQRATPTVNITTIYRTLELLEGLALVRHTHLGHGAPTYSVHEHQHVHLVCHRCGHVVESPKAVMDQLCGTLRATHGFELDASHLALSGTCQTCSQENP
ncbi:nickel uptake regulator, Fur family [Actinokineospora globicatena]|uniref:Transcriptional repressor n=2 Tax=Actinokineospora globicatena TaxID=103729 RepID=A0A9W6QKZ7_9PSEU|nr:Fur family transcriptional regulator [Actinokineospora globicatena]MCP2301512.1 nickel uptake regulator, Fur family [Actinokineospora globicatena]GLW76841.1 transcriptional repressor [Actinokineospora globicatena]GLW83674.1 transcriptional repressor [Actinokineospora globicatena]GLW92378.1 transcriptional repressor [Actinokineospora globicatena]